MKTIKIFLASSEELADERLQLADLVEHLNQSLQKIDVSIQLVKWEYLDSSMGPKHKQEEYNEVLKTCELCLVLFWTHFGQFTKSELDTAYHELCAGNNPKKLYVYFKNGSEITSDLKTFRDSFADQYGHFYCHFDNIDTLKADFLLQFMEYQSAKLRDSKLVGTKNGKVVIDGIEYVDLQNVPFAGNNEEYNNIKKRILDKKELLKYVPKDEPLYSQTLNELNLLEEKLDSMESSLWDTALTITKLSTTKCSSRLQRAINLFSKGDNKGAQAVLKEEEIEGDMAHNIKLIQLGDEGRKGLITNVEEYRLKIKTFENDLCEGWDEKVEALYERILSVIRDRLDNGIICTVLWDYSNFLVRVHKHSQSIERLKQLLSLIDHVNASISSFEVMTSLARSYLWTNNYREAERYYLEALNTTPITDEAKVECFVGLGDSFYLVEPEKAEFYYQEALNIAMNQPESNDQQVSLSRILNNLANIYCKIGDCEKALKGHQEALSIRQKLSSVSPESFEYLVAFSYKNIGDLYVQKKQYDEAREAFTKSLAIRRELAQRNPAVYNKQLAMSINGLANVLQKQGRLEEAVEHYKEALKIRRELASRDPNAYNKYVARSLQGLGITYTQMHYYEDAEKCLQESLDIRTALFELYPESYRAELESCKRSLEELHLAKLQSMEA